MKHVTLFYVHRLTTSKKKNLFIVLAPFSVKGGWCWCIKYSSRGQITAILSSLLMKCKRVYPMRDIFTCLSKKSEWFTATRMKCNFFLFSTLLLYSIHNFIGQTVWLHNSYSGWYLTVAWPCCDCDPSPTFKGQPAAQAFILVLYYLGFFLPCDVWGKHEPKHKEEWAWR